MGFSTTLTEVIILIASIVLASGTAAYAIYAGVSLQSNIVQNLDTFKRNIHTRVDVGYAAIDTSTSPAHFVIYVKNTGTLPITDYSSLDVYVGTYGRALLYSYSASAEPGSGRFSLSDVDGDGVWEPYETATIRAYPTAEPTGSVYEVKIIPYRGIPSTYIFPSQP
ncbi:MAG: hypothetical protein RMJ07_01630 [Nitrososphaerota archaeon]|nr:flagellin [Candidatus Bathyarchaeota archaeon]MDW8048370.1 hypothetical protein [Nitrososphaerota archaeon]